MEHPLFWFEQSEPEFAQAKPRTVACQARGRQSIGRLERGRDLFASERADARRLAEASPGKSAENAAKDLSGEAQDSQ